MKALTSAIESNVSNTQVSTAERETVCHPVEPVWDFAEDCKIAQGTTEKAKVDDLSSKCDTVIAEEHQAPIVRTTAEPVCHEKEVLKEVPATIIQPDTWKMSRECADIIKNASLENLSREFLLEALNCFYTIEPPPEKQALILAEMRNGKEKIPIWDRGKITGTCKASLIMV